MPPRNRGSWTPLALAAAAVVLMAGPKGCPQGARTTLALALVPLRVSALATAHFADRVVPSASAADLEKDRDFWRTKAAELHERATWLERQAQQLQRIREVIADPGVRLLPASVVLNADASAWRRTITITRGTVHGVARDQLVLCDKHVVGRVAEAGPWSSRVLLVCDPAFKCGAVAVPRRPSDAGALGERETGIFEGDAGQGGVLKWLAGEAAAEEGALVVTASDPARGVPRGLILGRVAGAARGRGATPRADVAPFVNPRALEAVVVVLGEER